MRGKVSGVTQGPRSEQNACYINHHIAEHIWRHHHVDFSRMLNQVVSGVIDIHKLNGNSGRVRDFQRAVVPEFADRWHAAIFLDDRQISTPVPGDLSSHFHDATDFRFSVRKRMFSDAHPIEIESFLPLSLINPGTILPHDNEIDTIDMLGFQPYDI